MDVPRAPLIGVLPGAAVQDDARLPARLAHDLQITPAQFPPDARAEGLADRLLGREPGREVQVRELHGVRVGNFALAEDAVQEAVTEPLERGRDALSLNNVGTEVT